jgi:polysaccharide export outer membrane protein
MMACVADSLAARGLRIAAATSLLAGIFGTGCRTSPPPGGATVPASEAVQPAADDTGQATALPESYFRPYDPAAYRLAVGDVVEISVFGYPDTVSVTPVAPDGKLYYLFMNGVTAAGRAPPDVARDMEGALNRMFNNPTVSILPRQFAENRFLAIGKVVYPNVYPLESALTLRQAIARAGGLAQGIYRGTTIELASLRDSYLLRDGERVPVDFEALIHRNDASQDIFVRPGDRIVIASGLGREVFLMGAVGEQKAAGYTDGMTLVELISGQSERGGGYNPTARLGKVLIVRGALENPTTFDVDLSRILKGLDPDVYLMPGDIVYVPEKPYRFARDLTRAVVLTFVRTFASEAGAELVDETIFLTAPSDPGRAP